MLLKRINSAKIFLKFWKNTFSSSSNNTTMIKEIIKNVHPFSKINISSGINISIKPYDLLDCPDANILKASIIGPKNYLSSPPEINIQYENKEVNIKNICNNDIENKEYNCILEVPVKCDLNINAKNNVEINDMHSDEIILETDGGNIKTKNLRSVYISLYSKNSGNINCKGILLAQNIYIKTENNGNINLDKLQGNYLECQSCNGGINTNSCYVNDSKFITKNGILILKNVHKNSNVFIEQKGNIKMIGVHGNININGNGGNEIELQLDELYGNNSIILNDSENVIINISDIIENNCLIDIHSDKIILDKSIEHLNTYLKNEKYFCNNIISSSSSSSGSDSGSISNNEYNKNNNNNNINCKLLISTKGLLKFGKKSWIENLISKC